MTAYVVCGIQGSGKTTVALKLESKGVKRFSFDELEGADMLENGAVLKAQMHKEAISALKTGTDVVLDAAYTTISQRKEILSDLSMVDCRKVLIVMTTPYAECLRRNAMRGNPIPEHMIVVRKKLYRSPTVSEGWDEIVYCGGDDYETDFGSN